MRPAAVVAGADVEITNLDENTTNKVSSNDAGLYQFVNMKAGRYSLSAGKPGFNTARVAAVPIGGAPGKALGPDAGS